MTQQHRLRPLAALALVALISAGCGRTTLRDRHRRQQRRRQQQGTGQDKAVKFAECMRENGVSDFPDPDASGGLRSTGSTVVTDTVWTKAVDACKDLQPPGFTSSKRSPKQQTASLRFAQCIRENGVKDFPDPVNGEPVVNTYRIPSSNRPGGMTILNAAMKKCGELLGEAAGGR